MLQESLLGACYRAWLDSFLFSLLQRLWHGLGRLAGESWLGRLLFGPTRGDALWSDSLLAHLIRAVMNGLVRLLRAPARWIRESAVAALLRRLFRGSAIFRFEALFGVFCCAMLAVPHALWNNTYALLGAVLFLGAYLLLVADRRRALIQPETLGLGLALFVLAVGLSMLFGVSRRSSLRYLFFFVAAFLLCYEVVAICQDRQRLRQLLGFLYAALLAASLIALAQRALNLVHMDESLTDAVRNANVPGRVYGPMDNPNSLAAVIQTFLPLCAAYAAATKKTWLRALLTLGLALPALALVMTYSRASWLAVALAAAVYLYYRNKKLLPALAVLALLCIPVLPTSIVTRFASIFNAKDSSRGHRFAIWDGVCRILSADLNWVTGIGMGSQNFQSLFPYEAEEIARNSAYHSHMLYLELDLEFGLLGLFSFLWMLLKLLGRAHRAAVRRAGTGLRLLCGGVVAALAATGFAGLTDYVWYYPRCLFAFFLFLGVTFAALRLEEREAAEDSALTEA